MPYLNTSAGAGGRESSVHPATGVDTGRQEREGGAGATEAEEREGEMGRGFNHLIISYLFSSGNVLEIIALNFCGGI